MKYGWRDYEKFCRWCGCRYKAEKPLYKDGFHSAACKQAHYRAYKNYVTAQSRYQQHAAVCPVTRKKQKKNKKC